MSLQKLKILQQKKWHLDRLTKDGRPKKRPLFSQSKMCGKLVEQNYPHAKRKVPAPIITELSEPQSSTQSTRKLEQRYYLVVSVPSESENYRVPLNDSIQGSPSGSINGLIPDRRSHSSDEVILRGREVEAGEVYKRKSNRTHCDSGSSSNDKELPETTDENENELLLVEQKHLLSNSEDTVVTLGVRFQSNLMGRR